jgi:hypothetical protein
VSDEARELIAEHNRLDEELYRAVSERFDRDAGRYPTFAAEVAAFERTNARYRTWGTLTRVWPQRVASNLRLKRPFARSRVADL